MRCGQYSSDAESNGFVETADRCAARAEFERSTAWRFMEPQCSESEGEAPDAVTCIYIMANAGFEASTRGPSRAAPSTSWSPMAEF